MLCRACLRARQTTLREQQRRTISSKPFAHTLYSPTPDSLTSYLSRYPPNTSTPIVYLLSTTIPHHNLAPLVTTLQSLPNSIGSFSASIPDDPPTLSIASFPGAKTWRSDITGRPAAEVGKYQRPSSSGRIWGEDQKGNQAGEIDRILSGQDRDWSEMWSVGSGTGQIPDLEKFKAESLLVLSDAKPNPLLRSLSNMFPTASITGMITAPTPFITSRPQTLFHNNATYSSGAVGLALETKQKQRIDYGLEPMTDQFTVVAAQGNMLLQLDGPNPNPTQTLVTALHARGTRMSKEEEFYMSVGEKGSIQRVVKILSGDPSRGALALETEAPLLVGQVIQYLQRSKIRTVIRPISSQIAFSTLTKPDMDYLHQEGKPKCIEGFVGYSEDGLIDQTEICNVPLSFSAWPL